MLYVQGSRIGETSSVSLVSFQPRMLKRTLVSVTKQQLTASSLIFLLTRTMHTYIPLLVNFSTNNQAK